VFLMKRLELKSMVNPQQSGRYRDIIQNRATVEKMKRKDQKNTVELRFKIHQRKRQLWAVILGHISALKTDIVT